jgi:hypothetical protein
MKRSALFILALTLILLAGCGKDANALTEHPWTGFKVGSHVKTRVTIIQNIAGKRVISTMDTMETLVDSTDEASVIEIETTVLGKTTKLERTLPTAATVASSTTPAIDVGKVVNQGTETIMIAGKPITCKWSETSATQGTNQNTCKVYLSKQVPGRVVKLISKFSGLNYESSQEVVEFQVKP